MIEYDYQRIRNNAILLINTPTDVIKKMFEDVLTDTDESFYKAIKHDMIFLTLLGLYAITKNRKEKSISKEMMEEATELLKELQAEAKKMIDTEELFGNINLN